MTAKKRYPKKQPSVLSRAQGLSDFQREQAFRAQELKAVPVQFSVPQQASRHQSVPGSVPVQGRTKRPPKLGYADKLARIRPFVNFDFKRPNNLGRKNKSKITRIFNQIQKIAPGNKFVTVTGNKHRSVANALFNQVHSYKAAIKGIWIPESQIGDGNLIWEGDTPTINISGFPTQTIYPLNQVHLAKDPRKAIEGLIADAPEDSIFVPLSKKDGAMINSTGYRNDKKTIVETILDWMETYTDTNQWLTGIKLIGNFDSVAA